ncbi:hypothetical protein [Legionella yabuuchiae]|uniref:hypothetical protein n=1 Tax=Legionella yabuuchiae TaxID=376727 RepID=UPI0010563655|nr:hypothetical protein [Legionella yabuuchiae]
MKYILSFLFLLLCNANLQALTPPVNHVGVVIPNQNTLKAEENKNTIKALFKWMNNAAEHPAMISPEVLNQYFSKSIQYSVNGKLLVKNNKELAKRLQSLVKKVNHIAADVPLNHLVSSDHMAAFNYRVSITDKKHHRYYDDVTVLAKLKHGKITQWQAFIVHEN